MSLNDKTVFDKKTLILVVLIGIIFFGWQKFLEKKYPDFYAKKNLASESLVNAAEGAQTESSKEGSSISTIEEKSLFNTKPDEKRVAEKLVNIQTDLWKGQISSRGMGFKNVVNTKYKDHEGQEIFFSKDLPLFEVQDLSTGLPFDFTLISKSQNEIEGVFELPDGTQVVRTVKINSVTGSLSIETQVKNQSSSFKGFRVFTSEVFKEDKNASFLMPSFNFQEIVFRSSGAIEHVKFSEDKPEPVKGVDLFAISSQYFTVAMLDKADVLSNLVNSGLINNKLDTYLEYVFPHRESPFVLNSTLYMGPKAYSLLGSVDPLFSKIVNFGFFGLIGSYLFYLLNFLQKFVQNWGLAIIALTLVVRILVLPFNIMSYRSMKKMAALQPKLKELRERYKDDPAAINRETMNLMKVEKANPLGGCLPMLLQLPIFFALYQVLGQSIELYQAPFYGWIQDLSLKDPYYVLPVLMGITLYIQHKITPTTMDPQQAKIMAWMPVIFSVFTLGLPSGLTLYIFVSTLFGVIQQRIFMMEKKS